jgi:hypothetical protein
MATMEDAINAHIAWMKKWTGIGIEPVDTVCHEYCNSKECRNLDKDPAGHAPRYQGHRAAIGAKESGTSSEGKDR